MNDFEVEYTQTKKQHEEMQLRFDIHDNVMKVLDDIERKQRKETVASLNCDAVESAIVNLILCHPVEFESILRAQRVSRDIVDEVDAPFAEYLAHLERTS